jgi:hypothetical protein
MPYSELAYFEGFAFAHIAEYEERQRLARKWKAAHERYLRATARRH